MRLVGTCNCCGLCCYHDGARCINLIVTGKPGEPWATQCGIYNDRYNGMPITMVYPDGRIHPDQHHCEMGTEHETNIIASKYIGKGCSLRLVKEADRGDEMAVTSPSEIANEEKLKYYRMWTEVPGYRCTSPGEGLVPDFLNLANWMQGDTLVDLGCGPGRAGKALQDAGLNVTLLDITKAAPDKPIRHMNIPFIEACLWDLPELHFDWVYCCDVMEHIPTEHVDKVLDNIQAMARKGVFFQIALWNEGWGNKIGEVLHLTVQPAAWWKEKIDARWHKNQYSDSGDGRLIVLTKEAKHGSVCDSASSRN